MNRSLLSFLLFLAVLVGGIAAVVWWTGPAMVSLALDDERRNAPYYLVHLLDSDPPPGYFQTFNQLLREEQGQLLWRGRLASLHAGRSRDELASVAILEFEAGSAVVQMLTSSIYRDLSAVARPLLLGTQASPLALAQDETLLLWLLRLADSGAPAILPAMAAAAQAHGGSLVWSGALDELAGDRGWNYLLLLAFPDSSSVQRWLVDPGTATDRSLSRRLYLDEALMELHGN